MRRTNGGEIVRRRERLGMRQVDLARAAEVDAGWLCRIENGEHSGSAVTVKRIADALGCTVDDLRETIEDAPDADGGKAAVA